MARGFHSRVGGVRRCGGWGWGCWGVVWGGTVVPGDGALLSHHWLHCSHFHISIPHPLQTPLPACNSFNSLIISSDAILAERSILFFFFFFFCLSTFFDSDLKLKESDSSKRRLKEQKTWRIAIVRHQLVSLNFHTSHTHRHIVREHMRGWEGAAKSAVHRRKRTCTFSPNSRFFPLCVGFDEIEVAMPWLSAADAQTSLSPRGDAI